MTDDLRCLSLFSFTCLPSLVLIPDFLVTVDQNHDEPQLQDNDQHIHHYLRDHVCQLPIGCETGSNNVASDRGLAGTRKADNLSPLLAYLHVKTRSRKHVGSYFLSTHHADSWDLIYWLEQTTFPSIVSPKDLNASSLPTVTTVSSTSFSTVTCSGDSGRKRMRWKVQRYIPVSFKVTLLM